MHYGVGASVVLCITFHVMGFSQENYWNCTMLCWFLQVEKCDVSLSEQTSNSTAKGIFLRIASITDAFKKSFGDYLIWKMRARITPDISLFLVKTGSDAHRNLQDQTDKITLIKPTWKVNCFLQAEKPMCAHARWHFFKFGSRSIVCVTFSSCPLKKQGKFSVCKISPHLSPSLLIMFPIAHTATNG